MSGNHEHTQDGHPSYLAHHFKSMDQQTSAGKLGMWLFMGQEMLFFSGIFCAFGFMRIMYPEMVSAAQGTMDWRLGCLNSAILLISSLTMGFCVRAARLEKRIQSRHLLLLTMLCGLVFLCIKGYEWHHHMSEGLFPGKYYHPHHDVTLHTPMAHIFFGVYYTMTGMHALHIVVGLGLMVWMLVRINRREFNHENYIALENTSLFWHLVDLVWIFVYPLIYLAR